MHNSQNITNELLSNGRNNITEFFNKVNECSMLYRIDDNIYGLSQNPDTNDYIMVLKDECCEKCEFFNKGNNSEYRDKIYGILPMNLLMRLMIK
ncbi:unnamed protein product [Rhizophagus irregularis]|nr:unnamed protein product [Rhizophagus irregularis]